MSKHLLLESIAGVACAALLIGAGQAAEAPAAGRLVRDGVVVEFEARPSDGAAVLTEDAYADVRLRVTDQASGRPLPGSTPGAWLDLAHAQQGSDGKPQDCRDKIALYLKGVVGIRPLIDLNGYYVLILNRDASISVIDPGVSMAGTTSTYALVPLAAPPMDWARSADGARLFVSLPGADQVAVVGTERFELQRNVAAGKAPTRVAVQPDGRYLWVGNDAPQAAASGVTVIDTHSLEAVLTVATGRGHHEIAFSEDSRHAFVSNRDAGTVTVFDVATLQKVKELATGPRPIALAYSALSRALYVADGEAGHVTVVDGGTLAVRHRVALQPGLGPMRFTPDGRFGFVVNPIADTVSVIDAASDEAVHVLAVGGEPFQVGFTRAFAYVRGLATERVTMVNLATLGKGREPVVQGFAAGSQPPRLAGDLVLADSVAPARTDAGVFVVSPADNSLYFYMEGMNAPMSGYPNRGHAARAVAVVDRSLKEVEPGVFAAKVKLPAAGRYDVAVMLEQPRVMHCFAAEVAARPSGDGGAAALRVSYLPGPRSHPARQTVPVRFRLSDGGDGAPRTGVRDLRVRYFMAPASHPREVPAREIGAGVYEALVELPEAGAYYLHVGAASLGLKFGDRPYGTLLATPPAADAARRPGA